MEFLSNSPGPVEFAEIRAHFTGLEKLLEEKDRRMRTSQEKWVL
jgi:hypothetical protein